MAISPPSDIVMDVVNAADPTRVQEAQDRLKAQAATLAAARLTRDDKGFSTDVASLDKTVGVRHETAKLTGKDSRTPETYRKFEAMVLQNFLKYMMPNDSSDVYGDGMAGDIWKSMSAEQIANAIAKRGGIGIADHLMRGSTYDRGLRPLGHTAETSNANDVASLINIKQQHNALADLLPSGETTDKKEG